MGGEEQALVATEEACRIYVGNLLPKAKEIHLTSKFARFGTIHNPPGFAFVRFASPDAAHRAVDECSEEAMEILGKIVRVQMAGDKDRKHSEERQLISSTIERKDKGPDLVSGGRCGRSRSRSSRRRERSEDSRGVHRSRSRDRLSRRERYNRRSSSRNRRYRHDRHGDRRAKSTSRSRSRRRGVDRTSRSRSCSRDRRRYEGVWRRSRSPRR
ncbi:Nucleotide binding protein [Phytophthora palmivora]|uniref:Nucleotide binding protein n=1 Tax=Phytophthora palmivora TaxID=4796 RepID=A0A2P4XMA5_9STRA|nr:Nucleotide binding protein [Phytophthora palmivora]